MVYAQVPVLLGWTAALLTRWIGMVVNIAARRVLLCAWGRMSCHRGSSHGSSGMVSRVAKGTGSWVGWGFVSMADKGSGRWILDRNKMGVAGTVPSGNDVGLV